MLIGKCQHVIDLQIAKKKGMKKMSQETLVLNPQDVGENSPLYSLANKAVEKFGQAVVEVTRTGSYARILFPVTTGTGYFNNLAEVAVAFLKDELILGITNTYKIQNSPSEDVTTMVREAFGLVESLTESAE